MFIASIADLPALARFFKKNALTLNNTPHHKKLLSGFFPDQTAQRRCLLFVRSEQQLVILPPGKRPVKG